MNETTKRVAISPSDDESEIFSKYYLHYYFLLM